MAPNETETALSPRQELALRALLDGLGVVAAAKRARIGRSTLSRWMREERFGEVYRREVLDLRRLARLRAGTMVDAALDVLFGAIQAGSVRAAVALLRGIGILSTRVGVDGKLELDLPQVRVIHLRPDQWPAEKPEPFPGTTCVLPEEDPVPPEELDVDEDGTINGRDPDQAMAEWRAHVEAGSAARSVTTVPVR